MYKERKAKINYGRAWIIVPILIIIWVAMFGGYRNFMETFFIFFILAVQAIIIDLYIMHKIYGK
jgi:hypothetical protein